MFRDYTTSDVLDQVWRLQRKEDYDNSLFGFIHNWATEEQRQPVQLPDDASLWDQAKEAGLRVANMPMDMVAGGAKTMAHWLGSAAYPEMIETADMLAPLGIGAMAGITGAVPRGAVGSAGGKLAANALDMSPEARLQRARDMGFDTDNVLYHGTPSPTFDEFSPSANGKIGPGVYLSPDSNLANKWAGEGAVIPVYARGKIGTIDDHEPFSHAARGASSVSEWKRKSNDAMRDAGYAGYRVQDEVVLFDPKNIRSVNAAFDPAKADSANLLAADQSRSSLPGLAANALDMSHEARMQRAKEMGFDTDNVLYHGAGKDFDEFNPGTRGNGTARNIYLTDDPAIADIYANSPNYGLRGGGDPMIYPVFAKSEKPLIVSDKGPDGSFGWVSDNLASALGVDHPAAGKYASLYDEARRQGYDQVQIREMTDLGGPQTQYIPLKPEYVRSVNAAFDPAKADSANLLAADQARSSLPGLLAGAVDEKPNDNELMRLLQLYGMMP